MAARVGFKNLFYSAKARKKRRIPTDEVGTLDLFPVFMLAVCKGRNYFHICKHFGEKIVVKHYFLLPSMC